jgi:cytochrome c biogenesis protein CcdA
MTPWLLTAVPFVTSTYAIYEMRRTPRVRAWAVAVLVSGAAWIFCLFGLEPLLTAAHTPSTWDGFLIGIEILCIDGGVLLTHFTVLGILMWNSDPDVCD